MNVSRRFHLSTLIISKRMDIFKVNIDFFYYKPTPINKVNTFLARFETVRKSSCSFCLKPLNVCKDYIANSVHKTANQDHKNPFLHKNNFLKTNISKVFEILCHFASNVLFELNCSFVFWQSVHQLNRLVERGRQRYTFDAILKTVFPEAIKTVNWSKKRFNRLCITSATKLPLLSKAKADGQKAANFRGDFYEKK